MARTQQGQGDADEIGLPQRLLKLHILDPGLFFRDTAGMAQIHALLNRLDVILVLIGWVIAQHVHVEPGALFDHG